MQKVDISQKKLYFKKIINVIKSEINNHPKPLKTDSRRSDAFIYIISGNCLYKFDDGCELMANKGDILYLAHEAAYIMNVRSKNYQFIFCDFNFDDDLPKKSAVYSPQSVLNAENLFRILLKCHTYPSKTSFTECMSILYNIYGIIMLTASREYIENSTKNKIAEAKNYIDANFKNISIGISFMAEKANMSEVYFRKLFKSQYDIPPSQYIISMRLNHAKELMKYPFLTLEQCALQSGFSSLQYFCRMFKKATGISPAKYRKER